LIIAVAVITWIISNEASDYFIRTKLFSVKTVVMDPSVPFYSSSEVNQLHGKNIFDVNVGALQNRLAKKYPQVTYIRVIKRFPDQVIIFAKNRNAFAQVQIGSRVYVLDKDGVILGESGEMERKLPLIRGVNAGRFAPRAGFSLVAPKLPVALTILKAFQDSPSMASYPISRIEVDNLSRINLYILDNLNIIVDHEDIKNKIKMLELILTQGKIDLATTKYVDLRFKEPVLGKK
jgi:cell division septal protein FtsQ